jgi:hypothetical protein
MLLQWLRLSLCVGKHLGHDCLREPLRLPPGPLLRLPAVRGEHHNKTLSLNQYTFMPKPSAESTRLHLLTAFARLPCSFSLILFLAETPHI